MGKSRSPGPAAHSRAGVSRINSTESSLGGKGCGCLCHGIAVLPLSQRTQGKQSATCFICLQPGLLRGPAHKPTAGIQSSRPGRCLRSIWHRQASPNGYVGREGRQTGSTQPWQCLPKAEGRAQPPPWHSQHFAAQPYAAPHSDFRRQKLLRLQFASAGPRGATRLRRCVGTLGLAWEYRPPPPTPRRHNRSPKPPRAAARTQSPPCSPGSTAGEGGKGKEVTGTFP